MSDAKENLLILTSKVLDVKLPDCVEIRTLIEGREVFLSVLIQDTSTHYMFFRCCVEDIGRLIGEFDNAVKEGLEELKKEVLKYIFNRRKSVEKELQEVNDIIEGLGLVELKDGEGDVKS